MMRFLFLCIAVVLFGFTDGQFTLLNSLSFPDVKIFTTDQLGNVYVVLDNQLLMFSSSGKPKAFYGEKNLGTIYSVDATNPMKIILFFRDFGIVKQLNSQLAEQSSVNLRNTGFFQPSLVCASLNEGFWIYDQQDFQLKKLDNNLQVKYQSGDLVQITGREIHPDFLTEFDGSVYMNDPGTGIIQFDRYGTYNKILPLTGIHSFQISGDDLLFVKEGLMYAYTLKTMEERQILIPETPGVRGGRIEQNHIYLLTTDSLKFYSF